MAIGEILREKRKALGLTQEQVANYVGITAPAVNKWEKGLSCPDLTFLPVLARLLKTDPNTLLGFQENLTDREITLFLNDAAQRTKDGDYLQAFSMAMEKVREYPQCAGLQHSAALVLEGGLLMAELSDEDRERCQGQITGLYERVAQSDDLILSNSARYMLASKSIQRGDYDKAQELLDRIPKKGIPDKRALQADLLVKQGKTAEAAAILERMALNSLQETLMTVAKLIPLLAADGNIKQAEQLADASRAECEAYGLWQYSAKLAPMQLAVSRRDVRESIRLIAAMLRAAETPWELSACPLFCHQSRKENSEKMGQVFLPSLLADLERSPEFAFLREEPAFRQLLAEYREKCQ
ncbi:MAG: helix-turn-helix domain-containing protein [Oscillibacter sp.]|nr:helix-turn-helix domain-containing protein [Oscillibacter sp.]